jgi:hypothetical protein
MKTLALLAAVAFGAALLTPGAQALPTTPGGASAPNDMIVQVKHKKQKTTNKKSKNMDQNNDNSDMGDKKGM